MTNKWFGASFFCAALCLPTPGAAHDVGPDVKLPGIFSVGTGVAAAHHWVDVDSAGTSGWLLGPLLQLQLDKEISPWFHSGAQLQGTFFLAPAELTLGAAPLSQPADVLVSLLWVNRLQPWDHLGFFLGVGPALNHFTEGGGAFFEATAFGAAEQLGVEFNLFPSYQEVHPYLSLLFLSSQTITGLDRPNTTDSVFSAGGMLTFRLSFEEAPLRSNATE